ncbi:MAG TPA: FtsX-like permease family protein, partial [Gemmatimonadaceae bacterium]
FPHHTQLWTPHPAVPAFDARDNWCCKVATAVARLRAGVAPSQAASALAAISRGWREKYPQIYSMQSGAGTHPQTLTTAPLAQTLAGELRPILLLLAVAVGLLTLIACANVASLQLVRATTRLRETALRVALGASRSAILYLAAIESLVIAVVGGALGLALGAGATAVAHRLPGFGSIFSQSMALDWRVAIFSAVTSLVVALAFGIAPALVAVHVDPNALLTSATRSATGGRRGNRLLSGAVVVQMSLALLLLFAAGLSIRSLQRLLAVDLGFRPEHVMRMRLSLTSTKYPTNPARVAFEHALIDRLRAMPGTIAAGTVLGGPFSYLKENEASTILKTPSGVEVHASIWIVGGDYFRAMQIPLRSGRLFDASDVPIATPGQQRTWIVDETLARQLFPGTSARGQSVAGYQANIVGEVGAIKKADLANANTPSVYWLFDQAPQPTVSAVVRTSLDASVVLPMMRTAVHELDPDLPVFDLMPLEQGIDDSLAPRRIGLDVLAVFAAMSLVLAVLGVYGVASYGTTRRSREIGIRIALGADALRVTSEVLGEGARLLAIAIGASVIIVLIAGRALQAFVFGVSTHDWLTLVVGTLAIGLAALGATWIPARRAARIDPAVTLRTE